MGYTPLKPKGGLNGAPENPDEKNDLILKTKDLAEGDPENKGVTGIDPENKGVRPHSSQKRLEWGTRKSEWKK